MILADRWLLPEGVDEVLPEQAAKIEYLRKTLLGLHESWGYHLVIPPLLEYLDSLFTGVGSDLEIETFKVIDQVSGRLMGVRADFTSQVSRIDAHCLKGDNVQRLSYCGSVLRTMPDGLDGTRSPIQLGAELYGHNGFESDIEILSLMLETLFAAGLKNLVLDLGHVDIVRGVLAVCKLSLEQESKLLKLYNKKDLPELDAFISKLDLQHEYADWLKLLPRLCGEQRVLNTASKLLEGVSDLVDEAISLLRKVSEIVTRRFTNIRVQFDLSDLVSYSYHTGLLFAAYLPGHGDAIARGGRYNNNIGEAFGRSRPATGFSTDVKALVALSNIEIKKIKTVLAPVCSSYSMWLAINSLRSKGYRVVEALGSGCSDPVDFTLTLVSDTWQLVPVGIEF